MKKGQMVALNGLIVISLVGPAYVFSLFFSLWSTMIVSFSTWMGLLAASLAGLRANALKNQTVVLGGFILSREFRMTIGPSVCFCLCGSWIFLAYAEKRWWLVIFLGFVSAWILLLYFRFTLSIYRELKLLEVSWGTKSKRL